MTPPPPEPRETEFDVLLVEDIASMRVIYEAHLRRTGLRVISAASAGEALTLFRTYAVRVVLLDLMLPDRDGLDLLVDLLELRPGTSVVVVAAERSVDRAVLAIRRGAMDFLVKPVHESRLIEAVDAARRAALLAQPPGSGQAQPPLADFIGTSEPMREVYQRVRSAARSVAPVFIWGESGSGKELAAWAVHRLSERASGPFLTLDCGAFSMERLDSELFGHRRGAFGGAVADKLGAAQLADGGTLFFDDICELTPALQPKLLRLLQTGLVLPLGADAPNRVNLRVIAACSMPPHEAMRRGHLREDLFYRLHVVPLRLPPLRERRDDIAQLAQTFLVRFAKLEGRKFRQIAPDALEALLAYDWPGNVRELLNTMRAITVMHDSETLSAGMLPEELRSPRPAAVADPLAAFEGMTLAQIERQVIEAKLVEHNGAVPRAAHDLGVAPSTLYRKLDGWRQS